MENSNEAISPSNPFRNTTKIFFASFFCCRTRHFSKNAFGEPSSGEYSTKRKGAVPQKDCAKFSSRSQRKLFGTMTPTSDPWAINESSTLRCMALRLKAFYRFLDEHLASTARISVDLRRRSDKSVDGRIELF